MNSLTWDMVRVGSVLWISASRKFMHQEDFGQDWYRTFSNTQVNSNWHRDAQLYGYPYSPYKNLSFIWSVLSGFPWPILEVVFDCDTQQLEYSYRVVFMREVAATMFTASSTLYHDMTNSIESWRHTILPRETVKDLHIFLLTYRLPRTPN